MTREDFERFVVDDDRHTAMTRAGLCLRKGLIAVRPPYDVVPCGCSDVNCHGWRIVQAENGALDLRAIGDGELLYES